MKNTDKICVIGLGYIGLPTALMMASHDVSVIGTDYNKALVETLNKGSITFEEDGLEILFKQALSKGIEFTNSYIPADIYIIAVPTPYDSETKKIDAKYVTAAVKEVLKVCGKGAAIVIESTVSPGTMDKYVRPVIAQSGFETGKDIHLVHAPERIIPGNMIYELEHNSRTIGCDDKEIGERIKAVYSSFCKGEIIITDIRTAEMTKVVENTFRDINIAYANELCKICRDENMDVYEIIRIANMHPRVNILNPGPGVGGHCISVDPWFLVGDYPNLAHLIHEARKVNDAMPDFVADRMKTIMADNGISDLSHVGLYGITYKADVDDTRESPTLQLQERFETPLKSFDPMVKITISDNQYHDFDKFMADIDMLVIMVSHSHIKEIIKNHPGEIYKKIILDTANICDKTENKNIFSL